ncbi:MAG: hypothetical protein LBG52_06480 [Candidatus Peribacteria bacterium]|jgi:hypothetical protein|nr:hypothetical protein [Candidatus Peribacteria bacterium]
MDTIEKARLNDLLTRAEFTKMISQYAINILGKTPNINKDCSNFEQSIQSYKNSDLYNAMITSCQLEIMGVNPDRSVITDFMPDNFLERRDSGTVLSRLLWGTKNENEGKENKYWNLHLQALKNAEIMRVISQPEMLELRGNVLLMLWNSVKKYKDKP